MSHRKEAERKSVNHPRITNAADDKLRENDSELWQPERGVCAAQEVFIYALAGRYHSVGLK